MTDIPPPNERPSLQQLASSGDGWECPRCGCKDWRVDDSYWTRGERRRRRFCRNCKQVLHTRETAIEDIDAQRAKIHGDGTTNSTDEHSMLTTFGIVAQDGNHDDADNSRRSDRISNTRPAKRDQGRRVV